MSLLAIITVALSVVFMANGEIEFRVGGLSELSDATPEIQNIVNSVRDNIVGELPLGYDMERPLRLNAVSYREQMVAGFNYFIKIATGWDRYIHVKIYEDLQKRTYLTGIERLKSKSDPIEYFDDNVDAQIIYD